MTNVIVTTAIALSAEQKQTLQSALTKQYGQISFQEIIDEDVLGGIKVTVGSKQLDVTVKSKLNQLRKSLRK